jgi:hypothetical protein
MKKMPLLIFIALPILAHAQLEVYGKYTVGEPVQPIINYFGSKKITTKISLTFFGLVRQQWSQALIGIRYAPSNSFNLSASTGLEHGTNSPRFSAGIWTEKGKTSFLLLGEVGSGKDNYLYKANLLHKYTEQFTFGIMAWRYHGAGPNLRFTIPKLSATIWSMPAYDFEANKTRIITGISLNM